MAHLEFIMFIPTLPTEHRQAVCQNDDSLFVLVGNPGVIWHPKSGQCLHTKLDTDVVRGSNFSDDPCELLKPCFFYLPVSIGRFLSE